MTSNNQKPQIYEIASGDITVWLEPKGSICLKICSKFKDPVELAEHEALELVEILTKLVKMQRE
jgi:hypothetical protein